MKDNSGKALLCSYESDTNIVADRCTIDNPKIEMISAGSGKVQLMNQNIITLCNYAEFKYKTIFVVKFCKCSNLSLIHI